LLSVRFSLTFSRFSPFAFLTRSRHRLACMNALFDAWRAAEPTTCVPFVHTAPNAPPSSAPTPLVSTLAHALLAAHNAPTLVTASFTFFFFSLSLSRFHPSHSHS
jgi:hypothetical protein